MIIYLRTVNYFLLTFNINWQQKAKLLFRNFHDKIEKGRILDLKNCTFMVVKGLVWYKKLILV